MWDRCWVERELCALCPIHHFHVQQLRDSRLHNLEEEILLLCAHQSSISIHSSEQSTESRKSSHSLHTTPNKVGVIFSLNHTQSATPTDFSSVEREDMKTRRRKSSPSVNSTPDITGPTGRLSTLSPNLFKQLKQSLSFQLNATNCLTDDITWHCINFHYCVAKCVV